MNKTFRQGQILKLIRSKRVLTQEDLARELKDSYGIKTTQVTLSRDIRELGLLKTQDGYQQLTPSSSGPDLATIAGEFLQDVRGLCKGIRIEEVQPARAEDGADLRHRRDAA